MSEDKDSKPVIPLSRENQPLWVALKLKTKHRRATFDFVYDHPGCVLADIHKGTSLSKHTILTILSALKEQDIVRYEEEEGQHRRHYFVNYVLVDTLLVNFRERVENYMAFVEGNRLIDEKIQKKKKKSDESDKPDNLSDD